MVGESERIEDTEDALRYAFECLATRQDPELLAQSVIEVLERRGIELVVREVDQSEYT